MAFPLIGILGSIFGNPTVISKGMDLIDKAMTDDDDLSRESKAKNKIDLLKAYAPFKVAQRYLAVMFTFTYILSYLTILIMTGFEVGNPDKLMGVIEQFSINWIMGTIVLFYFGGGMVESFGTTKAKTND